MSTQKKPINTVKRLRLLYKFTQADVADLIDYPKPLYVAFEQEKYRLPEDKQRLLAALYNVSVEYLMKDMPK